ncbi:MAG: AAA family ATPase [Chloroflexota bacterium]|nr:AAA family ATPase [Chloroflexota bacterium]
MFLRHLVIEDIKSIEHLELPFQTPSGDTRKWTLLVGENGTGKSTVLRAIAMLLAGSDALAELINAPDEWVRLRKDVCRIFAELSTAKGELREVELIIRRGDKTRDVFDRNRASLDALDSALEHADRNYMTIGYGVSRRITNEESIRSTPMRTGGMRTQRAQNVATLFSPDAVLVSLENWAMDLDYRRGNRGLSMVEAAMEDLLPDVHFERIDRQERQLIFSTPDGTVPLRQLSDGYQNVAAWFGDLLYRITEIFKDYKNPFSTRGLLLIDEIDLHLHPVWKRQLVHYLTVKLPQFQIVATTHSPLTAHQAGPGELFVMRRPSLSGPAELEQFLGEPRAMALDDFLLSPIFGVETADSVQVEAMREEYGRLAAKRRSDLTAGEKRRLTDLRREIGELPEWGARPDYVKKELELLEQIKQTLESR